MRTFMADCYQRMIRWTACIRLLTSIIRKIIPDILFLSAMWLWYKEMEKQKHIMWTVLVSRSCQILYSRESRR